MSRYLHAAVSFVLWMGGWAWVGSLDMFTHHTFVCQVKSQSPTVFREDKFNAVIFTQNNDLLLLSDKLQNSLQSLHFIIILNIFRGVNICTLLS